MKYLVGNYYVEVKDRRYKIHPGETFTLEKRDPPISLRTQNQVQNNTQIRNIQKVIANKSNHLVYKKTPKKQTPSIQQPKFKPSNCLFCRRDNWTVFSHG